MPRPLAFVLLLVAPLACPALAQSLDPALTAPWRVVEIEGAPAPFPQTLRFADGKVSGSGPCNRFSAGVQQAGQSLEIGQPVSTRMFCQGRMDAEKRYFNALHAVRSYALQDGALILSGADGRPLLKLAK